MAMVSEWTFTELWSQQKPEVRDRLVKSLEGEHRWALALRERLLGVLAETKEAMTLIREVVACYMRVPASDNV